MEMVDYLLSESTTDFMQDKEFVNDLVMTALYSKSIDFLKNLLQKYPSILNDKFTRGDLGNSSLLLHAGTCGSKDMVEYLVFKGLDVSKKDEFGCTVLSCAVDQGQSDLVEYLLKLDKINFREINPDLIVDAGEGGSIEIFMKLLDAGFSPLESNRKGQTALHMAAMIGHEDLAHFILNQYPDLIQQNGFKGWSTLQYAVHGGSLELVKDLIESGKLDTKHQDNNGETILHTACQLGEYNIVVYLTKEHKYLLKINDNKNGTPLHHASRGGDTNIFKHLVSEGLSPEELDNDMATMLHYACRYRQHGMVEHLLRKYWSCDMNKQNRAGSYPLHIAAEHGDVALVRMLMKDNYDVHRLTSDGDSILHIGCREGKLAFTQFVLDEFPTMISKKNFDGKTAKECAVDAGHVDIVKLFKR